jgi:hypothetical protein
VLYQKADIIPSISPWQDILSHLIVRDVRLLKPQAVAAGAFSDVYLGHIRGERVALKRPRDFLRRGPSSMKVCAFPPRRCLSLN